MAAVRYTSSGRLLIAVALLLQVAFGHGASIDEQKAAAVMAAYLRHIAALTTWPNAAAGRASAGGPILIGILGTDPNGVMAPIRSRIRSSEELLAQGRPIRLIDLRLPAGEEDLRRMLTPCGLLFLSEGSEQEWARISPVVASLPVVTVSEMAGFAERGGMIEYRVDLGSGKVRLIVNMNAMRAAGVILSARLLALDSVTVLDRGEDV